MATLPALAESNHSQQSSSFPRSLCQLNTGLLLLTPDTLTNDRLCDCLTARVSVSYTAGFIHAGGQTRQCPTAGVRQTQLRDGEVPEGGGVPMRMMNYELVIVCLLYDVSEMNAINLIGWSARRCCGLVNMRVPQRRRCSVLCSQDHVCSRCQELGGD